MSLRMGCSLSCGARKIGGGVGVGDAWPWPSSSCRDSKKSSKTVPKSSGAVGIRVAQSVALVVLCSYVRGKDKSAGKRFCRPDVCIC